MGYNYSDFGSLLSSTGLNSIKSYMGSKNYSWLNTIRTTNSSNSSTYNGFDTTSIFNLGTTNSGSYTGINVSGSSTSLLNDFYSYVSSYTTPSTSSTTSSSSSSTTSSKSSTNSTKTSFGNILGAASAQSVSDLIALLPKTGSLNANTTSGKMQSFFA